MWWLRFLALPPPPFVVGDVWLANRGLAAKPAFGPKPRLNDQQLVALEALLKQGAVAHGWPNHLWTSKRVAVMIQRHFGIHYHPAHVYRLLVQHLNWTSRKPLKRTRERNIQKVERWTSDDWPRIIRQAYQRHARLALLDEITLSPQAQRVGLHFMLLDDNKNFHGEEVVLFLRQLKSEVGGPWTIVWDRSKIHSKSKVVKQWPAKHPDVVVENFPAHAPNTNPDEFVWSWTKYILSRHAERDGYFHVTWSVTATFTSRGA